MPFFFAKSTRKRFSLVLSLASLGIVLSVTSSLAQSASQVTRAHLSSAIYKGNLDEVKALVAEHPEIINETGVKSPLGTAVEQGQLEIASFLLDRGANPNIGGWDYNSALPSPLLQALSRGDLWRPLADRLVQAGADINLPDTSGKTPLLKVLENSKERQSNRQKEQVSWLLAHKAQLYTPSFSNESALDVAINKTGSDIVDLLLSKANPKRRDALGQTPLFAAIKANKLELIRPLMARGADINAQDVTGQTVLHLAARGDKNGVPNGELIKSLLDAGANPNIRDTHGDLPLHLALRRDITLDRTFLASKGDFAASANPNALPRSLQLAPLLAKTDVDARDGSGLSPLLLAILARDVESRDLIRQRHPQLDSTAALFDAVAGADFVAVAQILKAKPHLAILRLPDGSTPLHIAALWGTLSCAKELLKRGADVNARDGHGNTPLYVALENPDGRFLRRSLNLIPFLLASGADPNIANPLGEVPLHLAARVGDARLINALLNKGARIDAPTRDGETTLLILTNHRTSLSFYKTLLARGADVNARGGYLALDDPARSKDPNYSYGGQNPAFYPRAGDRIATPLHRAVLARRTDLLAALLAKGANLEAYDGLGFTPLALAVTSIGLDADEDAKTVELLTQSGANPNVSANSRVDFGNRFLLWRAVERGNPDIVRALLATHKISRRSEIDLTELLSIAVGKGALEVARLLLDEGANPTARVGGGFTFLEQVDTTLRGNPSQAEFKELLLDRIKQWPTPKIAPQPAQQQPKPGQYDFYQAITKGDLERIKAFFAADPTLVPPGDKMSLLRTAIEQGQLDIAHFLLDHGANPNSDGWGTVPLDTAVEGDFTKRGPLAELLIEKGVDINSKNQYGRSLFEGTLDGDDGQQKARVQWLLSHGADIYSPSFYNSSQDGVAAVDMAIARAGEEARNLILEKADIARRNSQGQTPLFTAVRAGRSGVVRSLLNRGADANAQDNSGDTPLHYAARLHDTYRDGPEIMNMLLGAGANPNLPNKWGDLPLHIRLRHEMSVDPAYNPQTGQSSSFPDYQYPSHAQHLDLLLGKTNLNARDSSGYSPLLESIVLGDEVGYSLVHDCAPALDSTTRFFDAVASDHVLQVVQILRATPYLAFFRLPDGSTPLHIAAQWGALRCAEELIKRGASVNARNSHGYTPLHNVLKNPTPFFARRAVSMTRFLLSKGASVNAVVPSGDAPLHMAARVGNTELVSLFLQKGASINARGAGGATALFILTNPKTNTTFYKKLLAQGADPNAVGMLSTKDDYWKNWTIFGNAPLGVSSGPFVSLNTNSWGTTLHRAVLTKRRDLILTLLDHGAHINTVDSAGQTPLRLAVLTYREGDTRENNQSLAALLLSKGADPDPPIETGDMLAVVAAFSPPDVLRAFLATHKFPLKSMYHRTPLLIPPIQQNRIEAVRALLDAGVNPLETDEGGRTPLSFATSEEMKKLLADHQHMVVAPR